MKGSYDAVHYIGSAILNGIEPSFMDYYVFNFNSNLYLSNSILADLSISIQRNAITRRGRKCMLMTFTFGSFLFLLHLLAIFLQLLVCEFVEGVGTLLADDHLGLVLLFDDGFGCSH